jgi:beta-lactamase superfamily II metal-dependent hydrolase
MVLMQPDNDNPYEFIFGQGKQQRPPRYQPRSNANKILLSVGFVTGVIIVLVIGFSVITSIGKAGNDDLITVRAEQTELTRVLELGLKNVTDITTKNTLASLQLSVDSDSASVGSLLNKRGVKIDKVVLASKKDADTDKALETALQNGSHDSVLIKTINSLAESYYSSLKTAKQDVESTTEKELLDRATTNLETFVATQK